MSRGGIEKLSLHEATPQNAVQGTQSRQQALC